MKVSNKKIETQKVNSIFNKNNPGNSFKIINFRIFLQMKQIFIQIRKCR